MFGLKAGAKKNLQMDLCPQSDCCCGAEETKVNNVRGVNSEVIFTGCTAGREEEEANESVKVTNMLEQTIMALTHPFPYDHKQERHACCDLQTQTPRRILQMCCRLSIKQIFRGVYLLAYSTACGIT